MVTRRLQTAILGIAMAEPARRQSELRERGECDAWCRWVLSTT